jgi:hypothetical protein
MAQIHATADAVTATAKALLALADDPNEVEFTHGPEGAMFIVSDALADKLVAATGDDVVVSEKTGTASVQAPVELESPDDDNPTPPPPPPPASTSAPAKVNPRAKVNKE